MTAAALLLLADGRFPSGGHAHSAGVEAACATGGIVDVSTLADYLHGRLHTAGLVDASFAAAAAARRRPWALLDDAYSARVPSPRWRDVSRGLGRQALRAGRRVWPDASLDELHAAAPPEGPHQPIALGALAAAAGLTPGDAAALALHHLASTIATATVRLLGLDPFAVHAMLAAHTHTVDALAAEAHRRSADPLDALPAASGPLVEILAEDHATWEVRLFAS